MIELGKQSFVVSHLADDSFVPDPARPGALLRDLGLGRATEGMARAYISRQTRPPEAGGKPAKPHYHDLGFQFSYCLKGWVRMEIEGQGEVVMRAGSAWLQPPGIKHRPIDRSADFEMIEIHMPEKFGTWIES